MILTVMLKLPVYSNAPPPMICWDTSKVYPKISVLPPCRCPENSHSHPLRGVTSTEQTKDKLRCYRTTGLSRLE
ncbi:hypothetical protein Nmel_002062 [Mimus melanotis]